MTLWLICFWDKIISIFPFIEVFNTQAEVLSKVNELKVQGYE